MPLFLLTSMGVAYGSAATREAELNAIADSASLVAVTPAMMAQGDAASVTAAKEFFNAQASALQGVNYNASNLTVTVTDSITTRPSAHRREEDLFVDLHAAAPAGRDRPDDGIRVLTLLELPAN